jgi:hypothetical protein
MAHAPLGTELCFFTRLSTVRTRLYCCRHYQKCCQHSSMQRSSARWHTRSKQPSHGDQTYVSVVCSLLRMMHAYQRVNPACCKSLAGNPFNTALAAETLQDCCSLNSAPICRPPLQACSHSTAPHKTSNHITTTTNILVCRAACTGTCHISHTSK